MRTRNAETPKSAAAKKTPPAKKSAAKTPPETATESATPKSTETKRASAAKAKQSKANETTPSTTTDLKSEPTVEEAKASADEVTPETKAVSGTKTTRTVVKRTPARTRTPASAKAVSRQTPKSGETGKVKIKNEEVEDAKDVESAKKEEPPITNVVESAKGKELVVVKVESKEKEDRDVTSLEEIESEKEQILNTDVGNSPKQGDPPVLGNIVGNVVNSPENQEQGIVKEEEELNEEMKNETKTKDKVEPKNKSVSMEEDVNEESKGKDAQTEEDEYGGEERMEYGIQSILDESGDEELADDNVQEHDEEANALAVEHAELTAAAKERKIKKELEIFVGGLDRDAVEEDVKKAFENIGEVVEVRLHKDHSTNKNKGYAFVKFSNKEQASRALSEMKNPVIRGKRCGTAPSEDNDTLFLGNICNTWTKEAIKQKLKDYGIDGVENITLVPDAQHEGLSRGFAFLEFSCHADAMLAYKRLQKPDVVFGHPERTAKVAFAEPLREPDPEVMAQVKSVFVDGLPPHWDEDRVREHFKGYGEIERIMLARNMSTAKRKDFGFVDFTTHDAAVTCIDGINNIELGDGNSKTRVKARLSNPLPKTQAVKGGMCGGFRIGRGGAVGSSKFGRGFVRGAYPFNRPHFQCGRGFYQRGGSQTSRMGFANEHDLDNQYPPFHGRLMFGRGGRRGSFGGAHVGSGRGAGPARPNNDRLRQGASDRGRGRHIPARREPFAPEEGYNRPFLGRNFDDPYFYDDNPHGMKRPFFMTDQDPDYMEPSRLRPRFDYSDPAVPFRGSRYRDTFGAGNSFYSHGYYGSEYGGGAYSSFYGGDRPYDGGYYY